MDGPENVIVFDPVYAVLVVVPLVVAVRLTLNDVPAVLVPARARTTFRVGGAEVVADSGARGRAQFVPSSDWTVYE